MAKKGFDGVLVVDGEEWEIETEADWKQLSEFAALREEWMRSIPGLGVVNGVRQIITGKVPLPTSPEVVEDTLDEPPHTTSEEQAEEETDTDAVDTEDASTEEVNTDAEPEENSSANEVFVTDPVPHVRIPLETQNPDWFPQNERTIMGKIDGFLKHRAAKARRDAAKKADASEEGESTSDVQSQPGSDGPRKWKPEPPPPKGRETIDYIERACVALGATTATNKWAPISHVCYEALVNGGWEPTTSVKDAKGAVGAILRAINLEPNSKRISLKSQAIMLNGTEPRFPSAPPQEVKPPTDPEEPTETDTE